MYTQLELHLGSWTMMEAVMSTWPSPLSHLLVHSLIVGITKPAKESNANGLPRMDAHRGHRRPSMAVLQDTLLRD
jgi:hypothetical protein